MRWSIKRLFPARVGMDLSQYSTLRNGKQMPLLGLGTFKMGGAGCIAAVDAALRLGYRHIDTAAIYRNEEAVSEGIRHSGINRGDIFVTSKLSTRDAGENAYAACLATLERLKMEYLDLYLIHWPGTSGVSLTDHIKQAEKRKQSWIALERLYSEGRCRAIGVSNYMPRHLQELCSADWCTVRPFVNQFELHPLLQQRDAVSACTQYDVHVVSYSTLAQASPLLLENPVIQAAAAAHGVTPAQVCLRWAVQHGWSVIPKSERQDRIESNGNLFSWELSAEEMEGVDALDAGLRMCWDPTKVA